MFTIYWGEVSADSDGPVEMVQAGPGRRTRRRSRRITRS